MLKLKYLIFFNLLLIGVLHSNWNANIKFGYDTNVMKYSNSEDLIISANYLQLFSSYSKKIKIISKKTKVTFLGKKSFYSLSEKSNYSYGLRIKQSIGNYRYISFKYNYVDDIYLRTYVDVDQGVIDFIYLGSNCFFDNSKIDIGYEFPISNKKSKINISYLHETQFYNQFFTEFDLEIHGFKIKYSKYLQNNKSNIFSLRINNAKNISLGGPALSSSYMDRGYFEFDFGLINRNEKTGFSMNFIYREYSSNILEDQLHLNRSHIDIQYSFWSSFYLFNMKNKIVFKNRKRVTYSDYNWVENLKSFDKLNIEYIVYF